MTGAKIHGEFDCIFIGSGPSSLLLAHRAQLSGQKVAVFEGSDTLGGPWAGNLLEFFPGDDRVKDLLSWAADQSQIRLEQTSHAHSPLTFAEGSLREFLGFGDKCPRSVNDLLHFHGPTELLLAPSIQFWWSEFLSRFSDIANVRQVATQLRVENGCVKSVQINGDRWFAAQEFYFEPSPQALLEILPQDAIENRHRQRLAKLAPWTAICLHFQHPEALSVGGGLHFLFGGSGEFEPTWGRFFPEVGGGESSRWVTLIADDRQDDHEFVAQALRNMKRQLRRAYPALPESLREDRLIVAREAYGQIALKTKNALKFPELTNLTLLSHLLGSRPGFLGAFEVARATLESSPRLGPIEPVITAGGPSIPPAHQTQALENP